MPDYPKEQLRRLYKNLPKDLQEASYSQKVASNIQEICTKNGITDEDLIFEITKNIGHVFLGLLPPNEFSSVLEKELKIEKKKANNIASEITRFVFLPVKRSLEALYKIEIKPGLKPEAKPVSEPATEEKPKRQDKYREPIE